MNFLDVSPDNVMPVTDEARAAPRRDDWGGGRGPLEVDSFHAPPIGIMLNAEKFAGDRSPPRPPVPPPPGAAAHGAKVFN